jgi:hypothetical protein
MTRTPTLRRFRSRIPRTAERRVEPLEARLLLAGQVLAALVHDVNGNGVKDPEEPALEGWTVFVDYNRDGLLSPGEPSAVTDIDGEALLTGIPDNTWDVREILEPGFAPSPGFDDFERVRVGDGDKVDVLFLNVETAGTGTLQGTVWNDVDHDGVRGPADPGIPGWTVFLDLNTDQVLNPGEPSTLTDAGGFYSFAALASGQYRVREITPTGWDPTIGNDGGNTVDVRAGRTTVSDFGNYNVAGSGTIRGTVWNDVNADGLRAAGDPGLGDWTVFVDLNHDGVFGAGEPTAVTDAAGVYSFPPIAVGAYTVVEVLKDGWNLSPGHGLSVTLNVTNEGANRADFANYTPTLGSIGGRVWNDQDGNGVAGAAEPGLSGWTVFIDSDSSGTADAGEPASTTDAAGNYTLAGVPIGSFVVREVAPSGWTPTAPGTGMQLVNVQNGTNVGGVNFGNKQRTDGTIGGVVFVDSNRNGVRDAGERGLSGIAVYLDFNNDGVRDPAEPSTTTSTDLFYTPAVNEAGTYQFTHLAAGIYNVRQVLPDALSATPAASRLRTLDLGVGEQRTDVHFADVYRQSEIHGVVFDDVNHNHVRDPGETGIPGVTVYIDVNRNDVADATEPRTVTDATGAYHFTTDLGPGSYVVRALHHSGRGHTYPETGGGVLWPAGVSNPVIGNVTPASITTVLPDGQSEHHTVSLTLPTAGSLTDKVDVFLLFDDTGSFTANSPIVRAAFPQIIAALQAAMPGVDFGFGVGRFEEYANFASEYATGRPFVLNQPIVAASTPGFATAIQAALDRTAPGYGGDTPETDIEALYQMASGAGFDGNNNGTTTDSGAAGLVSTQLTPGASGDVPSFASFTVDAAGNVLPASGSIGGAGFRPGALPIILTATDTGFAFQPAGETSVTGVGGLTLPMSAFTQTSRPTTPFNSGAALQQTITALNALGALVVGLGTNGAATVDPRQGLEALAKLTGAVNRSLTTIPNGTLDPIAPGDPLYFQIASGFGPSVANGIVTAIQNAVSTVSVNLTVRATDPRVQLGLSPAVVNNLGAGETATFDVTLTGDGRPHRFDLQFVREGTSVVLGSIPVVIGTPIPGDGYGYTELEEGEIEIGDDFGDSYDPTMPVNVAPSFTRGADQSVLADAGAQTVPGWATAISAGPAGEAGQVLDFLVTTDNAALFSQQPAVLADGTLKFTPAPGTAGIATVAVRLHDSGGSVGGGEDTSAAQTFTITVRPRTAASVAGRQLFYNRSALDGNDPAAGAADDAAIDWTRTAVLPGGAVTSAAVSNYSRGINGLMIDVGGLPPGVALTAADYVLNVGDGTTWTAAPVPAEVAVRRGAGASGTDRVTLTFSDSAIRDTWLKVTLLATANTGLAAPDVFYFGNLAGDTGNDRGAPTVNAIDLARTRAAAGRTDAASLARYDFNRDGAINAIDVLIVRVNQRRTLAPLGTPAPVAAAISTPPSKPPRPPSRISPPRRGVLEVPESGLLR